MAGINERKKELDSEFTTVQRRNMNKAKPQQQLYRPGSGPLRKSNTGLEETESDTNLVISSRQNAPKNSLPNDDVKYKSEGSSNRDRNIEIESASRLSDMTMDGEPPRRTKKREQQLYVPKPLAQARDNASHETNRGFSQNDRGFSDAKDRFGVRSKRYSNRRKENADYHDEWREKSPSVNRQMRQGSEPRGLQNGVPWQRQRDTRSVEPSCLPTSNRNAPPEKLQQKPPSGRRHSTIGMERHPKMNQANLPPRFKKLLEEQMNQSPPVEENWDGSSITFQGSTNHQQQPHNYFKNPSFHPSYNNQMPNQNISGYHTLPNRPRGRGRLHQDHQITPGDGGYNSMTPERVRSPCNSRPHTPPCVNNSRPHTPVGYPKNDDYRSYNNYDDRSKKSVSDRLKINRQSEERWDYDNRRDHNRRDYDGREGDHRKNQENRRGDRRYPDNRRDRDVRRDNDNRNYDSRNRRTDHRNLDRRRDYGRREEYSSNKHLDRRDNQFRGNNRDDRGDDGRENGRQTPVNRFNDSLEAQLSEVSPESVDYPEENKLYVPIVDTTLDWSEEVELNDRLEQEALSDALTRSSSMASLVDVSTKSMPPNISTTPTSSKKSKSSRRNRRRSKQRSSSNTRDTSGSRNFYGRRDSVTSVDNFKVPQGRGPGRRRKPSQERRDSSYERFHSRNASRDCSFDRGEENWRTEIVRSRQNSERETLGGNHSGRSRNNSEKEDVKIDTKKAAPGIIVLPQKQETQRLPSTPDQPKYPDTRKTSPAQQKSLFDPNNPSRPIIVQSQSNRVSVPGFSEGNSEEPPPQMYTTDQFGNLRPSWYDENLNEYKSCRFPELIQDIKRADNEIQIIINNGLLLVQWNTVESLREFLKQALEYLLCRDLKFCETLNVEQHLWKILYYNIIEVTRKAIKDDPDNKEQYKGFILYLIDEGNKYFEHLLELLEDTHKFKLYNYIGNNYSESKKGLGYIGLALNSSQKLFLFLGDLSRYREQVNETANYGKCRQWYIKSHEINPKNGKPYNQLALLAHYSRRKLDAVYYFMRSLMSSNPVPSAKESLTTLFDEIRKKYEQGEKKRREERQERARQQMKQKESEETGNVPGSLRKETWIRPDGGRRVHRTTQAPQDDKDSEEEDLASLSSVEVNKRFVTSYLHVHGKLYNRVGLETFQEAALQMLKEFRALLQHSPVPIPSNRFLQLLALNMFAIDSTQLKDPQLQSNTGYHSELQEKALVISLQMFNLILERCISLLQEHLNSANQDSVMYLSQDINALLPAIKIWCDWMLCHNFVWNPPPSTQDFKVGSPGDAWTRLAILMNILERLKKQDNTESLVEEQLEGYELVKLPEDSVLCGFTPLTYTDNTATYAPKDLDPELGQQKLRLEKLLFFGTEFLCGQEPPVLKLEILDDFTEYVSVVCTSNSRDSPPPSQELDRNNEVLLESFSDEEGQTDENLNFDTAGPEIRHLLNRKNELEKTKRDQELHLQRVKKILSQSVVSVHIEVRPKYLVPDTNCFVDHLDGIRVIASSHSYTLMVPIVVLSELEGLAKGGKCPRPDMRKPVDPQHTIKVADSAKKALEFLKSRHQAVKCVTTKGAILTSTAFTTEDGTGMEGKNDDKILTTCLVLCKNHKEPTETDAAQTEPSNPRELVREIVLLTEDRNLRVKAHARDVPVRELPDFMDWAGLLGG